MKAKNFNSLRPHSPLLPRPRLRNSSTHLVVGPSEHGPGAGRRGGFLLRHGFFSFGFKKRALLRARFALSTEGRNEFKPLFCSTPCFSVRREERKGEERSRKSSRNELKCWAAAERLRKRRAILCPFLDCESKEAKKKKKTGERPAEKQGLACFLSQKEREGERSFLFSFLSSHLLVASEGSRCRS